MPIRTPETRPMNGNKKADTPEERMHKQRSRREKIRQNLREKGDLGGLRRMMKGPTWM